VTGPASRVIQADGRSKAYRPLPRADRAMAVREGLEAYDRGDFFLAHELLEPAWMGTDDLAERALIQGLIKLAAADVHGVRGNPAGVARNLEGALERLRQAMTVGSTRPDIGVELDLAVVIAAAERRLELATSGAASDPVAITWRPR